MWAWDGQGCGQWGVQRVDQQTVLGQSAHGAKVAGLPSLGPTPFALLEWGTSAPPTLGVRGSHILCWS